MRGSSRLGSVAAVMILACSLGISGQDRDRPAAETSLQRLDTQQVAELEQRLQNLYA